MIDFYEKHRELIDQLYISEGQNFCQSHFHRHIELLYVLENGLLVTVNKETRLIKPAKWRSWTVSIFTVIQTRNN